MTKEEKRQSIKKELLEKYGIKTDRDLVKQLGIKDEDKSKLYLWIEYQRCFSYEEGYSNCIESENERMKAEIAKLPKLDKGDKIKLYGKETEVIGFNVAWNEGLFDYEIILLTEGRGDPFKRSLGSIEILPQPPKQ